MERPRFFLDSGDDAGGVLGPPSAPSFVLDSFVHVTIGRHAIEVMTGLDAMGNLSLCPLDGRGEHFASIQGHLAHAEVATPERRRVEAAPGGLWLFALEVVEQLPDAPGPNDPVYLYGTLWPADDPTAAGARGQLTSTRGDILRGLVEGARWAFRFPPDEGERVPRAFHLMLPGDRADALAAGRGLVLAYPAMDPGLMGSHAGNDIQLLQIGYDLLAALEKDPDRVPPRGSTPPLPVPDREGLLHNLTKSGWEIDEIAHEARRKSDDGGFLKSLFGGKESIPLPAQATVDDYVRLAAAELGRLPGWPTPASQALFARVGAWSGVATPVGAHASHAPPAAPRIPTAPPSQRPVPATAPAPRPPAAAAPRARRDEWMQDFVNQHAAHQPQLTRIAPPVPSGATRPATRPKARPDWMKDFE